MTVRAPDRGAPRDPRHLTLPLPPEVAAGLRAGERVILSGPVYAARDAAHRRLVAAIAAGAPLPLDLEGASIYYVGPTPARAGRVIGAAGPTTAARLDPFTEALLARGLRVTIGKGDRSASVRDAIARHGAVYLIAVGGSGALLSRHVSAAEVVAYDDLGTEAIRRLQFDRFPALVACDAAGGCLFEQGRAAYRREELLGGYGRGDGRAQP